jgi:cell wall-associated NlpC family hydrolase
MELKYDNLLGKPWEINKTDCFSIVVDFFDQNFDIKIPNFARPVDWNADKLDLVRMLYPKGGFEIMDDWNDLRPADVLATCFGTSNPNHLVIYVGNNEIVQHKFGVNSNKETYRPAWKAVTGYILRHPDVPDLRMPLPNVTLEELLSARFKREV